MTETGGSRRPGPLGRVVAIWGLLGVVTFLGRAIVGLAPKALEPLADGMTGLQWTAYVACVLFMGYTEGYRGFQKGFSPRVVVRAEWLARNIRSVPWLIPIAPAMCMGWIYATKRRLIGSWAVTLGVVGLVLLVRQLPQPWRGVVDAGVVVGLTWGVVCILVFMVRALGGKVPDKDPQVPESAPGAWSEAEKARAKAKAKAKTGTTRGPEAAQPTGDRPAP